MSRRLAALDPDSGPRLGFPDRSPGPSRRPRRKVRRPRRDVTRPMPTPLEPTRRSRREVLCEPEPGRVERANRGTARWGRHVLAADSVEALRAVGAFGVAEVSDLAGMFETAARGRRGLRDLRDKGLLRLERFRQGASSTEVASLTATGKRLLERSIDPRDPGDEEAQRFRARPARRSQLMHDVSVFRSARLEIHDIESKGWRILRVLPDDDLKGLVCRRADKAVCAGAEPGSARAKAAESLDLTLHDGKVVYPDVRIEYERRSGGGSAGGVGYVDVEVSTPDYRGPALRAKAAAGFRMYHLSAENGLARVDSVPQQDVLR